MNKGGKQAKKPTVPKGKQNQTSADQEGSGESGTNLANADFEPESQVTVAPTTVETPSSQQTPVDTSIPRGNEDSTRTGLDRQSDRESQKMELNMKFSPQKVAQVIESLGELSEEQKEVQSKIYLEDRPAWFADFQKREGVHSIESIPSRKESSEKPLDMRKGEIEEREQMRIALELSAREQQQQI